MQTTIYMNSMAMFIFIPLIHLKPSVFILFLMFLTKSSKMNNLIMTMKHPSSVFLRIYISPDIFLIIYLHHTHLPAEIRIRVAFDQQLLGKKYRDG